MRALVGYTGFVGSNIYAKGDIDAAYNSSNIESAFGTQPELLIYAGMRAEKYLANTNPEGDFALVEQAEENISQIKPRKLVLISTIDVLKKPVDVDEDTPIDTENLHPYGLNRYRLEEWVRSNYEDALIVRLPGLFGRNIKKNFIFDYINVIPTMLKDKKFLELSEKDPELKKYYKCADNGFYKVKEEIDNKDYLKGIFRKLGFSALNFTDSRSVYQFYNLDRLWEDIKIALSNDISLLHLATEPISAGEVYSYLTGESFVNELDGNPAMYNFKTKYADLYGGRNGYLCDKDTVLKDIKEFVNK